MRTLPAQSPSLSAPRCSCARRPWPAARPSPRGRGTPGRRRGPGPCRASSGCCPGRRGTNGGNAGAGISDGCTWGVIGGGRPVGPHSAGTAGSTTALGARSNDDAPDRAGAALAARPRRRRHLVQPHLPRSARRRASRAGRTAIDCRARVRSTTLKTVCPSSCAPRVMAKSLSQVVRSYPPRAARPRQHMASSTSAHVESQIAVYVVVVTVRRTSAAGHGVARGEHPAEQGEQVADQRPRLEGEVDAGQDDDRRPSPRRSRPRRGRGTASPAAGR